MSEHCQNSQKAIVTIKLDNGSEVVISHHPPVSVQCSNIDNATSCVGALIRVEGDYEFNRGKLHGIREYCDLGGTLTDSYSLALELHPNYNSATYNEQFYLAKLLRNGEYTGYNFENGGWFLITIISVTYSDSNKEIIVEDTTGVIYKRAVKTCDHQVSCDDRCPAGQERILTIEYPGYKCREKCPPETCCECDCGDVICCYGSQGQVLKTIPK